MASPTAHEHSAAAHVEDAFSGVMDDEFKRPWLQLIWAKSLVFVRLAMGVYIGLGFFERPSWCYSPTIRNCTGPSGEAVPLSGLPLLPLVLELTGAPLPQFWAKQKAPMNVSPAPSVSTTTSGELAGA